MSADKKETKDLQVSVPKTKTKIPTPVVAVENGQAVTTTLDVARYFHKRHKNVMRAVEKLRDKSLTNDKQWLNFEPLTTIRQDHVNGGNTAVTECYRLTRDGFVMLAMGFTGERATAFKWAYIDAFNAMEEAILKDKIWIGGLTQALERICPTPPREAPSIRSQRARKMLLALTAYWAMIAEMPQEAAETAVCVVGKIQRLNDFDYDQSQSQYHEMYDLLERAIAYSSAKDSQPASEQQINTIKSLVEACAQFRYSRDRNIYETLREDYGISVETILTATAGQARQIAVTVYTVLRQQNMQTRVINEIKRRAKKADEWKTLPKAEGRQAGDEP